MKIRSGFVSNSSSSSFVIAKTFMTKEQIHEFQKFLNSHDDVDYYVSEDNNYFSGGGENYLEYKYLEKLEEIGVDFDRLYRGEF